MPPEIEAGRMSVRSPVPMNAGGRVPTQGQGCHPGWNVSHPSWHGHPGSWTMFTTPQAGGSLHVPGAGLSPLWVAGPRKPAHCTRRRDPAPPSSEWERASTRTLCLCPPPPQPALPRDGSHVPRFLPKQDGIRLRGVSIPGSGLFLTPGGSIYASCWVSRFANRTGFFHFFEGKKKRRRKKKIIFQSIIFLPIHRGRRAGGSPGPKGQEIAVTQPLDGAQGSRVGSSPRPGSPAASCQDQRQHCQKRPGGGLVELGGPGLQSPSPTPHPAGHPGWQGPCAQRAGMALIQGLESGSTGLSRLAQLPPSNLLP